MKCTRVFSKNLKAFNSGVRRIVNAGGTSSSKTYSILQLLFLIANKRQKDNGCLISIMSETMPHLKMGAIRDFEQILKAENMYNEANINFSDHQYYFGKSIVEFFSADTPGKVTGPRRDILYVNECNNIPYKLVEQAELRTRQQIIYDYNPTAPFWIIDKVMNMPSEEYQLISSNYLDNSELPESVRHEIALKAQMDPNFKRVHIDVEWGFLEGLIFSNWTQVDKMPDTDKQAYGMDFGFTNDPSTLIDVRVQDGEIWVDELMYKTSMLNTDIIREMKGIGVTREKIIADSSEPKSIREIELAGFNIRGAVKGTDSVRNGIDLLKSYKINVTKRSVNLIKELRNYKWRQDKSGALLQEPIDAFNHCIDPLRYVCEELLRRKVVAPSAWIA